jgi:CspA family cold shock protein
MSKHVKTHVPADHIAACKSHAPPEPREPSKSAERIVGRLVNWNPDRGIGWLRPDSGDRDIFVGIKEVSRAGNLSIGDKIEFAVRLENAGRVAATDLKVV